MKSVSTAIARNRISLKLLGFCIAFFLALFWGIRGWLPLAVAQQPSRPHILYIMADDQGWKDVGFHGSDIKTPNLDRLAQTGARLEQYYAQPMCTPSRAALMTGRYPHRYGLQTLVIPSAGTYGLATDEWLLPQALKEAGYKTAIVGKWHLGHADRKYWPKQRGFDYQYGPILGEIDYFTHTAHGKTDWYCNNQLIGQGRGLCHNPARSGCGEANRSAGSQNSTLPVSGIHHTPCPLSSANRVSGAVQEHP